MRNNYLIVSPPHTITLSPDKIIYQLIGAWIKEYTNINLKNMYRVVISKFDKDTLSIISDLKYIQYINTHISM